MSKLPDLHEQALMFKNTKRLQHDGGRAWSGDSQLHEARKGGNGRLRTIHRKKEQLLPQQKEDQKSSI